MKTLCIVCNKTIDHNTNTIFCNHTLGKYNVATWHDGEVHIYDCMGRVLLLQNPKKISEEYIEMLLLLK